MSVKPSPSRLEHPVCTITYGCAREPRRWLGNHRNHSVCWWKNNLCLNKEMVNVLKLYSTQMGIYSPTNIWRQWPKSPKRYMYPSWITSFVGKLRELPLFPKMSPRPCAGTAQPASANAACQLLCSLVGAMRVALQQKRWDCYKVHTKAIPMGYGTSLLVHHYNYNYGLLYGLKL